MEDYDKAASFFTKRSVNAIQHNSAHEYSFTDYCAHFNDLESFELSPARQGKADYWHLMMTAKRGGDDVRYSFYFENVGGKWFLTESENSYFWNEPAVGEPHARLQIMTYRDESARVDYPPGASPDDVTVLVHRIGHDRAIPAHPILKESDGSFRCRIHPGTHQVEYEVIQGKREDQQITYSVVTQEFEAGRSYVLSGYSIKIDDTVPRDPRPDWNSRN